MMKMWSKIFWEKRGFWEPFRIFLLLVTRPVSRVWRTLVSIQLTSSLERTSAVSLSVITVSSRWIPWRVFLQRDGRTRWMLEKIKRKRERKKEKETMTPSSLIRGRIALGERGVRTAFWRLRNVQFRHPMDFAPYHRVSSGSSALCYHYC